LGRNWRQTSGQKFGQNLGLTLVRSLGDRPAQICAHNFPEKLAQRRFQNRV
jgi:hypothetical protein